jgi:hypothetical protein
LDCSAALVAVELAAVEHRLLANIPLSELSSTNWVKKEQKAATAPHIHKVQQQQQQQHFFFFTAQILL